MAKQEEIREGMAILSYVRDTQPDEVILSWEQVVKRYPDIAKFHFNFADKVLKQEHSQGVVIKVRGELPSTSENPWSGDRYVEGYEACQKDMASYTLTEALIKE